MVFLAKIMDKRKRSARKGNNKTLCKESVLQALWSLAQAKDQSVFDFVTNQLARYLDIEFAIIVQITPKTQAKTLSLYNKGEHDNNFTYDLDYTPCSDVVSQKKVCVYNGNVQEQFPQDKTLKELNIESYIGCPLLDSDENAIGLIIIMSQRKIEDIELAKEFFLIHQNYAAIELERMIIQQKLAQKQRRLALISDFAEQNPNPVFRMSQNGRFLYCNPKARELVEKCKKHKVEFKQPFYPLINKAIKTQQEQEVEIHIVEHFYLFNICPVANKNYVNVYAVNITDRVLSEKENTLLAHYDQLTGISNRNFFTERLEEKINSGKEYALLLIDIDNFKSINDSLGHYVGDLLLIQVAKIIKKLLPKGALLGRLGGDEFVLFLPNKKMKKDYLSNIVAQKLLQNLSSPMHLMNYEIKISCSIGISYSSEKNNDASILLRNADIAMYHAKRKSRSKNSIQEYNSKIDALHNRRISIENALNDSNLIKQLQIVYQPLYNIRTNQIIGVEALVRWKHPSLGYIDPEEFIKVSEHTGRIQTLGSWIIKKAAEDFHKKILPKYPNAILSVNISPSQLNHDDFVKDIINLIDSTKLPKNKLILEITETSLMADFSFSKELLDNLNREGISVGLDDFGTGYSSLNRLEYLPITFLKIDKSFLSNTNDTEPERMLNAIVQLADSMGIFCIQEGIETLEHKKLVLKTGCLFGQGYYLGEPKLIDYYIKD